MLVNTPPDKAPLAGVTLYEPASPPFMVKITVKNWLVASQSADMPETVGAVSMVMLAAPLAFPSQPFPTEKNCPARGWVAKTSERLAGDYAQRVRWLAPLTAIA